MSELGGLGTLLAGQAKPGVYRWTVPGATRRSDVEDAAADVGWRLFWLAGQSVTDKDEFLDLCAENFAFPDWFGHNWDALGDCLTDLTWVEAEAGLLVVYAGWQALAQESPEDFGTALEIFTEAVDLWRDSDTPMTVLLPGDGDSAAANRLPSLTR
jgi:RNAse (barnase) inhibitor barstar